MKTKNNSLKIGLALLLTGAGSLFMRCSDNFTSPSAPTGNTIVQVASTNDSLKAWIAAIKKVGLDGNLSNVNGGQFTAFAPSNYAFVKYLRFLGYKVGPVTTATAGDSVIKYLTNKITFVSTPLNLTGANNQKNLTSILNYHVISSYLPSSAIVGAQGFTTQNGNRLSVSKTGSSFVLNANQYITSSNQYKITVPAGKQQWNGANITQVDAMASNGIVHVIDQVMTPPATNGTTNSTLGLLGYTSSSTTTPIIYGATTIYNTPSPDPIPTNPDNYNLLSQALKVTGVALTLFPNSSPIKDYTIFAPKDSVFLAAYGWADEATALSTMNAMSESTTPKLSDFTNKIKGLVVLGRILSTDMSSGQNLTTLNGTTIPITIQSGKIFLKAPSGTNDVWIKTLDGLTNAGIVQGTNGLLQ